MKVTVHYEDGSVETFDTNALTTTSPLGMGNALTDFRVAMDDGLWIEVSWYRVPQGPTEDGALPLAQRSPGCRVHVLSDAEVAQARSIEIDGRVQWLRIGPDLCDVSQLDETTDLLCGLSKGSSCIAARVANMHDAIMGMLGPNGSHEEDRERLYAMLGMTEASYEYVSALAANVYGDEDSF
jgi:hypothetical protein